MNTQRATRLTITLLALNLVIGLTATAATLWLLGYLGFNTARMCGALDQLDTPGVLNTDAMQEHLGYATATDWWTEDVSPTLLALKDTTRLGVLVSGAVVLSNIVLCIMILAALRRYRVVDPVQ